MEVFYFGCWGRPGHYLWVCSGRAEWGLSETIAEATGRPIDTGFCPDPDGPQEGGVAVHVQRGGWSGVCWWDRSVDNRRGSNSQFWARGEHGADDLLRAGFAAFPSVRDRITYEVRVVQAVPPMVAP